MDSKDTAELWIVLINGEQQYSLWLKEKAVPEGWASTGMEGTKEACHNYVEEHWTDMRPLSLRQQMEAAQNDSPQSAQRTAG